MEALQASISANQSGRTKPTKKATQPKIAAAKKAPAKRSESTAKKAPASKPVRRKAS
jgi:hypothetical protein